MKNTKNNVCDIHNNLIDNYIKGELVEHKTLDECIEMYEYLSGRMSDAISAHDDYLIIHYRDKIFDLVEYAIYKYDLYLYDIDLSETI